MSYVEKIAEKFTEKLISDMEAISLSVSMSLGDYGEFLAYVEEEVRKRKKCVKQEAGE